MQVVKSYQYQSTVYYTHTYMEDQCHPHMLMGRLHEGCLLILGPVSHK